MPLPERTETEAWTSEPRVGGGEVVGDVEADGTVGGERQAAVLGLVDLDDEADAAAGQAAGHAGGRARHQTRRVEVVDVERQRRPAGDRVRVRQDVEDGLGGGVDRWWSRSRSSWSETLPAREPCVVGLTDDSVRPSGRPRLLLRDDEVPACAR